MPSTEITVKSPKANGADESTFSTLKLKISKSPKKLGNLFGLLKKKKDKDEKVEVTATSTPQGKSHTPKGKGAVVVVPPPPPTVYQRVSGAVKRWIPEWKCESSSSVWCITGLVVGVLAMLLSANAALWWSGHWGDVKGWQIWH